MFGLFLEGILETFPEDVSFCFDVLGFKILLLSAALCDASMVPVRACESSSGGGGATRFGKMPLLPRGERNGSVSLPRGDSLCDICPGDSAAGLLGLRCAAGT